MWNLMTTKNAWTLEGIVSFLGGGDKSDIKASFGDIKKSTGYLLPHDHVSRQ